MLDVDNSTLKDDSPPAQSSAASSIDAEAVQSTEDLSTELDIKNQELLELQEQMLLAPRRERKAMRKSIAELDGKIEQLHHEFTNSKSPQTSPSVGAPLEQVQTPEIQPSISAVDEEAPEQALLHAAAAEQMVRELEQHKARELEQQKVRELEDQQAQELAEQKVRELEDQKVRYEAEKSKLIAGTSCVSLYTAAVLFCIQRPILEAWQNVDSFTSLVAIGCLLCHCLLAVPSLLLTALLWCCFL